MGELQGKALLGEIINVPMKHFGFEMYFYITKQNAFPLKMSSFITFSIVGLGDDGIVAPS